MATTFSFEDAIGGGLNENKPLNVSPIEKSRTFSFEDALMPVQEAQKEPEMVEQNVVEESRPEPTVAPTTQQPPMTSGFDVSAMSGQFKSGLAGMQEGWFANQGRQTAALLNAMDRIDKGEIVPAMEDPLGYQQMDAEQRAVAKNDLQAALTQNVQSFMEYNKEKQQYVQNAAANGMIEAANKHDFGAAWKIFTSDPIGVMQQLVVSNAPQMIPALVGGVAGAVAKTAFAGIGVGMAAGEFPTDFIANIADSLQESGVDLNDPKAVEAKLRDPKFIEQAGKDAFAHAAAVSTVSAIGGEAALPLKAGQLGANVLRGAANVGIESLAGGVGEFAGQQATGQDKPGEVIAEILGGAPTAVASTTAATIRESRRTDPESTLKQINDLADDIVSTEKTEEPVKEEIEKSLDTEFTKSPEWQQAVEEHNKYADETDSLIEKGELTPEQIQERGQKIQDLQDNIQKIQDGLLTGKTEKTEEITKEEFEQKKPEKEIVSEVPFEDAESHTTPDPAFSKVKTGKPMSVTMYQGRGKDKSQIYSDVQYPVAGQGGYYAPTGAEASKYGNVVQTKVDLKNPLVITNDDEWRSLTKEAGWQFPNPTGLPEDQVKTQSDNLKKLVQEKGHDGLVVNMDKRGDEAKTLRSVFNHDQVVSYKPIAETKQKIKETGAPPLLKAPEGFVLKKGRNEQVALAAQELAAGNITKAEYDRYVDYYKPIATVEKPEAGLTVEGMSQVLDKNQQKKINPEIEDGTPVGLRMDLNALNRGKAKGINGSVVSIHEGAPADKRHGKIIGYTGAAEIDNVTFASRNEEESFGVAQNLENRSPGQTLEGTWVNYTPNQLENRLQQVLNDPAWTQVSFDPERHSFFYDRETGLPVVSADKVLQVGRFLIAKNVKYGDRDDFLYAPPGQPSAAAPQITGIAPEVQQVIDDLNKLNPNVLSGVNIKAANVPAALAGLNVQGYFLPVTRVIRLMKGTSGITDPMVLRHEIMHSLEQLMTKAARALVIKAYDKALNLAESKAKTPREKLYFKNVRGFLSNATAKNKREAMASLPSNELYQYLSPSEYWAVNGEKLLKQYLGGPWQRFKLSARALIESIKNTLGLPNNHAMYKIFKEVLNGQFINNRDLESQLRKSRTRPVTGAETPKPVWNTPEKTWKSEFEYNAIDEQSYIRRIQEAIEKVASIPKNIDAFTKELLSNSRAVARKKLFYAKEVLPIVRLMKSNKVSGDELTRYAQAKFAAQRNAQIAARGGLADGGIGITTGEAAKYLQSIPPARAKVLEEIRQKLIAITKGTQRVYVDTGAEKQNTIDRFNREDNSEYLPMNRVDEDFSVGSSGIGGTGYSTAGKSYKTATGSAEKEVKDVFENVIHQRMIGIDRGERIRVGNAFFNLALHYPNPKFWFAVKPGVTNNNKTQVAMLQHLQDMGLPQSDINNLMRQILSKRIDPKTGQIVSYANPMALQSDNVLATRINGENAYVVFNKNDPVAMDMLAALRGLSEEKGNILLNLSGKLTRAFSAVTTQYNPVWGLFKNFFLDGLWVYPTLGAGPLKGKGWELTKKILPAMGGAWEALRAERNGANLKGSWAKAYRHMELAGGVSLFRNSFVNAKKDGEFLEKELKKLDQNKALQYARAFVNVLGDFNSMLESSWRLAGYKIAYDEAIKKGMPEEEASDKAAKVSKEITVNFDRRGAKTRALRDLYVFFNASMQSSKRLAEIMVDREGKITPFGKRIIGTFFAIGVMQAMVMKFGGLDDEDVPDYVREKYFVIPYGDKKYGKVYLPRGLSIFTNLGRIAVELPLDIMENKGRNASKKISSLVGSIAQTFNPLGESSNLWLSFLPSLTQPLAAVATNKDRLNRPISKAEQPGKPSPGYLRSTEKATSFSNAFAEMINSITGGSEFEKGALSPTGNDLDYLASSYITGLPQQIYKTGDIATSGKETPVSQMPIISNFIGQTDTKSNIAHSFYENVNEIAKHHYAYEQNNLNDKESKADKIERDYPELHLHKQGQKLVHTIAKLNKLHAKMVADNEPKSDIKEVEDRIIEIMKDFNSDIKEAKAGQ
jgi:hypothetical protein